MRLRELYINDLHIAYAEAIGWASMQWSFFEWTINELIVQMLSDVLRKVAESITANVDLRDKLEIAKAVGYETRPDDDWFDALHEVLVTAMDQARNQRNRYTHDLWVAEKDGRAMKKVRHKTTLKRPQARKPRELTTSEETTISHDEIVAHAERIMESAMKIMMLTQQHQFLHARARRSKSST